MVVERDYCSRVKVKTEEKGTSVSVKGPSFRTKWNGLAIFSFFLLVFAIVLSLELFQESRFPSFVEFAVFAGCLVLCYQLTWKTFGIESILIGGPTLGHRWRLIIWNRSKYYEMAAIACAWWNPVTYRGEDIVPSNISFTYGRRTIRIFHDVTKLEAQTILNTLTQVARIPQK